MRGVEVLAVETDDHACAPVITIGGTVLDVGSSVVTYTKATITAISPRHGSVTGGDVITSLVQDSIPQTKQTTRSHLMTLSSVC